MTHDDDDLLPITVKWWGILLALALGTALIFGVVAPYIRAQEVRDHRESLEYIQSHQGAMRQIYTQYCDEALSETQRRALFPYAKNADGDGIPATDPYATSFCIRGAILAVDPLDYDVRYPAYCLLENVVDRISKSPCDSLAGYNDAPERTQAEVLAVFDAAIALADPTA